MYDDEEIEIPQHQQYHKNVERTNAYRSGYAPCIVCGRAINTEKTCWWVRVHHGGSHVVSQRRGDWLSENGDTASELGNYPIGPDCLRDHPEIKPYASR